MYQLAETHYGWSQGPYQILPSRLEEDTATLEAGAQSESQDYFDSLYSLVTTVLLPCLLMLQRVSIIYKGHHISEKCDTNVKNKQNLLQNTLSQI